VLFHADGRTDGQTWNFMKIRPVGAVLFHADGTDMEFYENPSSGSRVIPCGWEDRHGIL